MPKPPRRLNQAVDHGPGILGHLRQDASAGPTLAVRPMRMANSATAELESVILPLQAAAADLRKDRIQAAWVELDIAETRLRFQTSRPGAKGPVLEKTLSAVERAREYLALSQTRQAGTTLAAAVVALLAA